MDGAVPETVRKAVNIQGKNIQNAVTEQNEKGTTLKTVPTTGKTKTPGNGLMKQECRR